MAPAGEERGTVEHPSSFDPGTETGYLRRGSRSHELDPEVGAAPFDPGPERYDGRRAKRAERRREKAERKRREKAERGEREREEAAQAERDERVRAQRERLERERGERQAAAAAELERERSAELELERADRERETELERAERQKRERQERRAAVRDERERAEAERRAQKERLRAERDAAEQQQKLERQRERRSREEHERAERKLAERRRRERKQGRSRPQRRRRAAKPNPAAAAASRPAAARRRPPAQRASLKWPTAKAGVALAAVAAVAVGAGVLLGLPLPLVGNSDGPDSSLAGTGTATIDPGTPLGLTKGPYHPVVVADPNYGETAAKFGADRGGRKHEGQDVFARPGTPLVAVRDGIVLDGGGGKSFYSYGGGNTLAIYSRLDDRSYIYLHMLKPALVRAGERVKAGQLVGYVGCTGSCDGPHLHFEVRRGRAVFGPQKKAFDPLPLLKQWPVRPVDDGK